MPDLAQVGLGAALWCIFHSWFVSHRWRNLVRDHFPRYHVFSRILYVAFSTASLLLLLAWFRTIPETDLFQFNGWWAWIRWLGLAEAGLLFWLGARSYDNRFFLGLSQVAGYLKSDSAREPRFREEGILGIIRHPWYTGTLIFLVFCLPYTDVNLIWRAVFLIYTLIGAELEERKLLQDVGADYVAYRSRVPRFFPHPRALWRPPTPPDEPENRT